MLPKRYLPARNFLWEKRQGDLSLDVADVTARDTSRRPAPDEQLASRYQFAFHEE